MPRKQDFNIRIRYFGMTPEGTARPAPQNIIDRARRQAEAEDQPRRKTTIQLGEASSATVEDNENFAEVVIPEETFKELEGVVRQQSISPSGNTSVRAGTLRREGFTGDDRRELPAEIIKFERWAEEGVALPLRKPGENPIGDFAVQQLDINRELRDTARRQGRELETFVVGLDFVGF